MKKLTDSISLCVASRNEEHLLDTLASAHQTKAGKIETVLWLDGDLPVEVASFPPEQIGRNDTPEGSSISKHRAICLASCGIIVLIDAHMQLPTGWDKAVLDHFANPKHDRDVLCGKMICMNEWGVSRGMEVKTGAEMLLKSHAPGDGWTALHAAWKTQPTGEIGCCMGAFYAFRKSWYLQMGQPLGVMQGLGCEEEMLSLGSWIMGGRVVLSELAAAHLMNRPAQARVAGFYGKTWRNRFRLVNLAPMDDGLRRELNDWLWMNPISMSPEFVQSVSADQQRPEVIDLKRRWAANARGWAAYAERWLNAAPRLNAAHPMAAIAQTNDTPTRITPPPVKTPRCQLIGLPVCPKCGTVDKVHIRSTMKGTGGTTKRYGECKKCKLPFTSLDVRGERRITWKS